MTGPGSPSWDAGGTSSWNPRELGAWARRQASWHPTPHRHPSPRAAHTLPQAGAQALPAPRPGTAAGMSRTQRHTAGCLKPQMGCSGFHGNAHPPAQAPLLTLVQGQASQSTGSQPTLHGAILLQVFAEFVPTSPLLPPNPATLGVSGHKVMSHPCSPQGPGPSRPPPTHPCVPCLQD